MNIFLKGMVNTEFSFVRYKGDQKKANTVYAGMTPLTGEDVAEAAVFILTRPTHVQICDIELTPTFQADVTCSHRQTK